MLVTYKAYAKATGLKPSVVKKYIEEGRIAGVASDARCEFLVPEEALVDYAIRKKSNRSMSDHAFNLMKALHSSKNVNHKILQIPRTQYESLVLTLINAGLVRRDRDERPFESGLALTKEGMELANQKKKMFLKLYETTIAAAAEGAARGFASAQLNILIQ